MNTRTVSLLIVESQPMMRSALSAAFTADGLRVVAELAEGREALLVAKTTLPDVVLFSINQPGLGELEQIAALHEGLPAANIVALVTGEFRGQEHAARDHGASLVMNKTAPRAELIRAVRTLMQKVH